MAGRYGGRFGTNQEQEQRRIQKEPVVVWKKEWVLPAGATANSNVKILKWVRTGDVIKFDEEDLGEETMAMDVDASTLVDPLPPASNVEDSLAATPAEAAAAAPALTTEEHAAALPPTLPPGVVSEGTPAAETPTPPPPTSSEPVPAQAADPVDPVEPVEPVTTETEAESQAPLSQLLTQPSVVESSDPLSSAPEMASSQVVGEDGEP